MGNFEAFTGNGVNIVTIQLIARCKTNRVYETVKFRPNFPQFSEHGVDAGIFCNIALQNDVRTQLSGKFFYAAFQFVVLVGECQFWNTTASRPPLKLPTLASTCSVGVMRSSESRWSVL